MIIANTVTYTIDMFTDGGLTGSGSICRYRGCVGRNGQFLFLLLGFTLVSYTIMSKELYLSSKL